MYDRISHSSTLTEVPSVLKRHLYTLSPSILSQFLHGGILCILLLHVFSRTRDECLACVYVYPYKTCETLVACKTLVARQIWLPEPIDEIGLFVI